MPPIYALLIVLVSASPEPSIELMTRQRTPVRESPSPTAKVLAELPPNIKIQSDKRKDFWFHISIRIEGGDVTGWVNQTDVTATMGRSKGQLLEENDRPYAELLALREAKLLLERDTQAAREALRKAEGEIAEVKRQLLQTQAELAQAQKIIERLEASSKQQDKADD